MRPNTGQPVGGLGVEVSRSGGGGGVSGGALNFVWNFFVKRKKRGVGIKSISFNTDNPLHYE